jgi:hypothetical protein
MSDFDLGYLAGVEVAALRVSKVPLIGKWLAAHVRKLMV